MIGPEASVTLVLVFAKLSAYQEGKLPEGRHPMYP